MDWLAQLMGHVLPGLLLLGVLFIAAVVYVRFRHSRQIARDRDAGPDDSGPGGGPGDGGDGGGP